MPIPRYDNLIYAAKKARRRRNGKESFDAIVDATKYISHKYHPRDHAKIVAMVLRDMGLRRVELEFGEVWIKDSPYKLPFEFSKKENRYRIPAHWWVRVDDIIIVDYMLQNILQIHDDVFPYGPFLPMAYSSSVLYYGKSTQYFHIDRDIMEKYRAGLLFEE